MSTKVRMVSIDHLAEIWDRYGRIHPMAFGCQLERTRSCLRIKSCPTNVLGYSPLALFLLARGATSRYKVIVKIIVNMATIDGNAVSIFLAYMKNIVPCRTVFYNPAAPAQSAGAFVGVLEDGVVEDIHMACHPFLTACVAHFDKRPMGNVPTAARRAVAIPRDVSPDV
jgi:hypothetical protein